MKQIYCIFLKIYEYFFTELTEALNFYQHKVILVKVYRSNNLIFLIELNKKLLRLTLNNYEN